MRVFNGFSQFWSTSVQFTHPCLGARSHQAFWSAVLSPCVTFLNDINDVLSFYKETVHGEDFEVGRLYRRSVQENQPYPEVFRQTFDNGLTAYRRVPALATDEQRHHLDRCMRAFIHWHFHSSRYRWQSIYPGLAPLEV
ncbi:hypothetical protein ACIBO6_29360 [Streptomyces luteogriseus]|uniref:hypothetical protein n=1 Tax=Streptomyces luteogriseus TaxID=68233 RepID=UPI00378EC770